MAKLKTLKKCQKYFFSIKLIHVHHRLPVAYLQSIERIHCVTVDNSYLSHSLEVYIQSLTTVSGSRLFGSVVEHWIIDPAARVRFPPKSWNFLQGYSNINATGQISRF